MDLVDNSNSLRAIDLTLEPALQDAGCEAEVFKSRAYWACLVRRGPAIAYNIFGSCRMGRPGDPNAVVDSNLR
jgi:hypothetical protein